MRIRLTLKEIEALYDFAQKNKLKKNTSQYVAVEQRTTGIGNVLEVEFWRRKTPKDTLTIKASKDITDYEAW